MREKTKKTTVAMAYITSDDKDAKRTTTMRLEEVKEFKYPVPEVALTQ